MTGPLPVEKNRSLAGIQSVPARANGKVGRFRARWVAVFGCVPGFCGRSVAYGEAEEPRVDELSTKARTLRGAQEGRSVSRTPGHECLEFPIASMDARALGVLEASIVG
jgi:hypothetical protein